MKRYSAPCRAILRHAEWITDEDETRGYERPYNRDEDNVSELPPPDVMKEQAMIDEDLDAIIEWWSSTM
jgi:hypothetical protein